jgi:hypothetical protein
LLIIVSDVECFVKMVHKLDYKSVRL